MGALGSLVVRIAADSKELGPGLEQAVAKVRVTGTQLQAEVARMDAASSAALKSQEQGLKASMASINGFAVGVGVVVGATVAHFIAQSKAAIDVADAMNDMSQRVGIGVKELAKYELASKQSGTTMEALSTGIKGLSGNLLQHGDALKKAGITATNADEAMKQLANVFAAMPDSMEKTNLAVKLFGRSGMELIPMLNMGADGLEKAAEKSAKYAATMAAMAPMADTYNDNMAELAMHNKVATMGMMNDLLPALIAISGAMADAAKNGGFFKGVMAGINEFGNQAFDWSGNAQRKGIKNLANDLADLQAQQARITMDVFGAKGSIQTQIEEKTKALEIARKAYFGFTDGSAGGGRGNVNPANVKPTTDPMADYKALMAALGGDEAKAKLSEYQREVIRLTKESAKAGAEAEAAQNGYNKAQIEFLALASSPEWAKYTQEQRARVAVLFEGIIASEQARDATKAMTKADLDAAAAHVKFVASLASGLDKMRADNVAMQESIDRMGLSKTAVADLDAAKLEAQANTLDGLAIKGMDRNLDEAQYNLYKAQAEELRQLAKLKQSGAAKEVAVDAAKEAEAAWKRSAESINNTLTDALMRGFEAGKGFLRNLGDSAVNMFKSLVLRPTISAVVNPVAQGVNNFLYGNSGQAGGANGLIGNSLGSYAANNVGSLFGGGAMAAANAATATGGSLAGAAYTTAAADSALAYGAAGTTAGMTGGAAASTGISGALAAVPVWGWIALAAIAIASQAKGETRSGGQYSYDANQGVASLLQGPSGGEISGDVVKQSIAGTAGGINGLLKGMGSSATLTGFQAGLESSDRGRGGVFAGGTLSTGATFGESGKGSNYEGTLYEQTSSNSVDSKDAFANFTADMFQTTIQAVQAAVKSGAGVPDTIAKMVDGVDAESRTSEAAQALVTNMQATVTGVTALHDAMATMGLKELSFDAAAGLIAAAGGMDKLGTSLSTYYDKFYSAEEKTTASIKATQAAFAKLGITMPEVTDGTRDWYRAQVDSLMAMDQTIEANAQATAGALALASAVDQIAPATDDAISGMQGFTDTVMGLVDGIHNSVAGSIWDMQYGLKDDAGKYGMLDQQAKGYDDAMRGATDINQVAEFAQKEIDTINKAFALLDPQQQADKLSEMTALLTKVDDFVTQSGADAISLKKAENADMADAVAAAVEKALETLSARLADATIAQAAATAKMGDAVSRPANVNVAVTNATNSEVRVS